MGYIMGEGWVGATPSRGGKFGYTMGVGWGVWVTPWGRVGEFGLHHG